MYVQPVLQLLAQFLTSFNVLCVGVLLWFCVCVSLSFEKFLLCNFGEHEEGVGACFGVNGCEDIFILDGNVCFVSM